MMHVTFAPGGILKIDGARIIHRNFSGAPSKFNREGERNFSIVIDDVDLKDQLIDDGWNVKVRESEDGGDPFMFLPVKVKFNDRGPKVYLKSAAPKPVELDLESINCLDNIDIVEVDLDIRPYNWEVNGKTGRTAYLQSIHVVQEIDRFAERYNYD